MPGRSAQEAFVRFVTPLQAVVSCLGSVKITPSRGGRSAPNVEHSWSLSDMDGVRLTDDWHFVATMTYMMIEDSEPGWGPWRVKTLQYQYKLARAGRDIFRLHWHPAGKSDVKYPHLHAALSIEGQPGDSLSLHLDTGRATLERAVRWAAAIGMPMARKDWAAILDSTESPHLAHRSWER